MFIRGMRILGIRIFGIRKRIRTFITFKQGSLLSRKEMLLDEILSGHIQSIFVFDSNIGTRSSDICMSKQPPADLNVLCLVVDNCRSGFPH